MADTHDSGRTQDRPVRMRPLVGLPGETSGEAVAKALRTKKKNLAQPRPAAPGDESDMPATTEDRHAT